MDGIFKKSTPAKVLNIIEMLLGAGRRARKNSIRVLF